MTFHQPSCTRKQACLDHFHLGTLPNPQEATSGKQKLGTPVLRSEVVARFKVGKLGGNQFEGLVVEEGLSLHVKNHAGLDGDDILTLGFRR